MPTLFDPIKVKNLIIQNRVVLPPLVRFSIIGKDGHVNEGLLKWYEDIAKSGVGLIIVEATCVAEDGKLRDNQLGIWNDDFIDGLSKIVNIIHRYNTKVIIQLHHAGFKEKIKAVDKKILDDILEKFIKAFYRAKKAGFDGIEIHGAHTYLLSQLASPLWNKRQDCYGGSFEKRMYFVRSLIERTKDIFDNDFILGYRMGGNEPTLENGIEIAKYLESLGVDILHVSSGVPDPDFKQEEKIPMPKDFPLDWVVYMGCQIKKHVNIPVIGVRKIKQEKDASWLIENNMLDMVAVGRAMIGNPSWFPNAYKEFKKRNAHVDTIVSKKKTIDIFCEIIDNFGDIGVVYRLAMELKRVYKNKINLRLIINKLDEFMQIDPKVKDIDYQGVSNFVCMTNKYVNEHIDEITPADVVIDAFSCDIPDNYLKKAYKKTKLIVNLEYLTGEQWGEDFHLQQSILPDTNTKKIFFFPGFSEKSGGILIDSMIRDKVRKFPERYLEKYYGDFPDPNLKLKGTIFSYEKNFIPLLEELRKIDKDTILLIMGEKSKESFLKIFDDNVKNIFGNNYKYGRIHLKFQEFLSQEEYEELINISDFNFVRGEDSIIRGILSGKPFLWHIYCQDNYAHMDKLNGFLTRYTANLVANGYSEMASELSKLFKDYNYREKNSIEVGNEDYSYFFKNLKSIEKANILFSEFLGSKCNLINNLKKLIDEYFRR